MRIVDSLLLEDEPDGGGVTAPPPSAPSSEGQPAEPEGASVPEEGASDEPAPDSEEQPASKGEETPADELTEEDWAALYEKYPDHDPRTAAEKAAAQARAEAKQEAEKPERIRAQDPVFRRLSSQAEQNRNQIVAAQRLIASGELPENPEELVAAMDLDATYYQAAERQGHVAVNRAIIERMLGIENGAIDTSNPLHKQYDDVLSTFETTQENAYRLLGQARREADPQKRADYITRSMYDAAGAVAEFYRQSLELAHAKGGDDREAKLEKTVDKRITATAQKARQNGNTEAIAKAKAAVAGGKAMATAAQPAKPTGSGPLTLEESLTLPIEELKRRTGG